MNPTRSLFVLDTNIFIEAHRRYYARDICSGFWECLIHFASMGKLLSIDRVREEILEPDALVLWTRQAPNELFATTSDRPVFDTFRYMHSWVQGSTQFWSEAKEEFARVADGWVAAFAKVNDAVVVTHEAYRANVHKRVPLPNVCQEFGIAYCDTFEMLRQLGVRFDWRQT